ncbi:MAG TPA: hypothetical protein VHX87_04625 [Galbitalea sp.]|jgi:hypothetical protein|nr:hypothetical protein [Galbitalea sp.]
MLDAFGRITFARELTAPDQSRRSLARAASAGSAERLARGAYLPTSVWAGLDAREKYLHRIVAVASTRRNPPVISHISAAAVWGPPALGDWPPEVHTTIPPNAAAHSRSGVIQHKAALSGVDLVELGGLRVTSLPRTIVDLATTESFACAIVAADRALLVDRFGPRPAMTTRDELEAAWERAVPRRAHLRAIAVLRFAETRAESPLESISRVTMRTIGVPRPSLQVPHYDTAGFIGEPDFYWPEHGLIGEADGDAKYLDARFRNDRSSDEVVLDEKIREDRLRALPRTVAGWRWKAAISPALLGRQLTDAGLPTGQKWQ